MTLKINEYHLPNSAVTKALKPEGKMFCKKINDAQNCFKNISILTKTGLVTTELLPHIASDPYVCKR